MSGRTRRTARASASRAARADIVARTGRGSRATVWIAAGLGVAASLATILTLVRARPPRNATPATTLPAPSMAPTSEAEALAAYRRGVALLGERRAVDALPPLTTAVDRFPDRWEVQRVYGVAIANAALETTARRGRTVGWARSSWERANLVGEAMNHLNLAERSAADSRDLAYVRHLRGRLLRTWGLEWEALFELERAARSDPQWREEWRAHQASLALPASFEVAR